MKAIVNGTILLPEGQVEDKVLLMDGSRIAGLSDEAPKGAEIVDAAGGVVAPGLIDVHCHGMMGWDSTDGSVEEIRAMSRWKAKWGTTAWLPTTMTAPWDKLERAFTAIGAAKKECFDADWRGAEVLGCHAEGPFINPRRKGAQPESAILPPDAARVQPWADVIRLMTCAPEMDGALDFIREARALGLRITMGHTDATAAQALAGVEAGATQATHTFNAMTGLNHREPGMVGAALYDDRVYCELIADTFHVNPMLYRILARVKGDHLVLITDSIQVAHLPDGTYDQAGETVVVSGIRCQFPDGTIAGSSLTMDRAVRNFQKHTGLPLGQVVNMASLYPARAIGVEDRKGSLEAGKDADVVIADRDFNIRKTFVRGECVYEA